MNVNDIAAEINDKEDDALAIGWEIKVYYEELNKKLQASGGTITDEIDEIYKTIDKQFRAKSKLESSARILRKELMKLILD